MLLKCWLSSGLRHQFLIVSWSSWRWPTDGDFYWRLTWKLDNLPDFTVSWVAYTEVDSWFCLVLHVRRQLTCIVVMTVLDINLCVHIDSEEEAKSLMAELKHLAAVPRWRLMTCFCRQHTKFRCLLHVSCPCIPSKVLLCGGIRFISWPGHWISWYQILCGFAPSLQADAAPSIDHDRFFSDHSEIVSRRSHEFIPPVSQ